MMSNTNQPNNEPRCGIYLNGKVRCRLPASHWYVGAVPKTEHQYDLAEIRNAFPKWNETSVKAFSNIKDEPRVCQRGVDGSEGCGHDERYLRHQRGVPICTAKISGEHLCAHACDFSPVHEPNTLESLNEWATDSERHEFVPRPDTSATFFLCAILGCGQPRNAEIHSVEPPKDEHLYPHEQCKGCGEMFETTNQRLTHWCKGTTSPAQPVAPKVSELGAFWKVWFEAVGEHATVSVINATANLVLAEREIAVRDARSNIAVRSEGEAAAIAKERERCTFIAETVNGSIRDEGKFRAWITNPNTCLVPLSGGGYALQEHVFDNSDCCVYCAEFKPTSAPTGAQDEVERALIELREMPAVAAATLHIALDRRAYYFIITIWPANEELSEFEVEGSTLTEAMQAVREFAGKEKS